MPVSLFSSLSLSISFQIMILSLSLSLSLSYLMPLILIQGTSKTSTHTLTQWNGHPPASLSVLDSVIIENDSRVKAKMTAIVVIREMLLYLREKL